MKVLVRNIVRKSRGGIAHRDEDIDATSIRLGRGADCELHLADPRMLLHQAASCGAPGFTRAYAVRNGPISQGQTEP